MLLLFKITSYCSEVISEEVEDVPLCKNFITFPADNVIHRKVNLQDAEISEEHKLQFRE